MKAEEKKINLFYLKDIVLKESSSASDRLEALFKIRKNISMQVFALAMKSMLVEFQKLNDPFVASELVYAIGCANDPILL